MNAFHRFAFAAALAASPLLLAAQTLGPVSTDAPDGKFGFGGGYAHSENDWSYDCPPLGECTTTYTENHLFLRGAYGFSPRWQGEVRLGVANSEEDGVGFRYGYGPSLGTGLKGVVYEGEVFSTGPAFQTTYYGVQEKNVMAGGTPVRYRLTDYWDATLGWGFQGRWDKFAVYGGPQLRKAQATSEVRVPYATPYGPAYSTGSVDIESDDEFGAYGGVN